MASFFVSADHRAIVLSKFIDPLPPDERRCINRLLWHVLQGYYYWLDDLRNDPGAAAKNPMHESEELWKFSNHVLRPSDLAILRTSRPREALTAVRKEPRRRSRSAPARLEAGRDRSITKRQVATFYYDYYFKLPVFGAVIVDVASARWLMVKGRVSGRWSFPRGKSNWDETGEECAVREVREETGFDVFHTIDPQRYLDVYNDKKRMRFYLISLQPRILRRGTVLQAQHPQEVVQVAWQPIPDCLYTSKHASYVHHPRHFHAFCSSTVDYTYETRLTLPWLRPWIHGLFHAPKQERTFPRVQR